MKTVNSAEHMSRKKSANNFKRKCNIYKDIYIMLIPICLYYILFRYIPILGNIMAFQDYSVTRGFFESKFIGLKWFKMFLNDVYFWRLLRNTVMMNIYDLIFGFPTPIILALLLNELKSLKYKKIVQTVTYMPHFISVVVASGIILDMISNEGLINSVITAMGFEPILFTTESKYFYGIYTVSDIWQNIGWNSIIYISALSGIGQELYEAASIDGASRWKQTFHVTLPCLIPTISVMLIMRLGNMLTAGYEKIMLLYNPSLYEHADVISTYVYRQGILGAKYSYSAAVGLFNSVVNFSILIFANWFSKKSSGNGMF